jgi:16S rRNA (cytosine967-C5)-methyltransferase
MPGWLAKQIDPADHAALLDRAPLDVRANRLKTTPEALAALWPEGSPIDGLSDGLRFDAPFAIEKSDAWQDGLVEIQDAGSQWVVAACRAAPAMTVVDLCAGGGGKTLALGAALANAGRLVACDTDRGRLSNLEPRARRAGAEVEVRLLDGGREAEGLADLAGQADVVLVDAPCSGSGTLRRNPEARWRLHPSRLDKLVAQQIQVLDLAIPLVKPGGAIIYAVCSLITREGAGQIDRFLARNAGWKAEMPFDKGRPAGHGRVLTPAHDGTDGFFVARLVSPC